MPRALLTLTVIMWGWTFVATKVLVEELGPVEILALRLAIGLPVLGGIVLAKRVPLRFTRADRWPLALGGGVFAVHVLIQAVALTLTTATNTGWIIAVTPLVLVVLSYLVLGERIRRGALAGIGVATLGILLLVSRGRLATLAWTGATGDWLVLVSAFTWACYTVVTRDIARRRDPLAVTLGVLLVAAIASGAVATVMADFSQIRSLSPQGLAALLYLAIPGQALGQWFWQEGVARLGASRAGVFLYLEPLATVALAVPLLGERLGVASLPGGGLVLAGVYVAQRGAALSEAS